MSKPADQPGDDQPGDSQPGDSQRLSEQEQLDEEAGAGGGDWADWTDGARWGRGEPLGNAGEEATRLIAAAQSAWAQWSGRPEVAEAVGHLQTAFGEVGAALRAMTSVVADPAEPEPAAAAEDREPPPLGTDTDPAN